MKQVFVLAAIIMVFGSLKKPDVLICGQEIESRWYINKKLVTKFRHPREGLWLSNFTDKRFKICGESFDADSVNISIVEPMTYKK